MQPIANKKIFNIIRKTNFEEIVIELEDGKTGQFTVFLMPKKFTIR